jgi:DNA-binding NtrC family response regulator
MLSTHLISLRADEVRSMPTTHLIQQPIVRYIAEQIGSPRDTPSSSEVTRPILLGDSGAARHLRSQIQRIAPYFRIALIRGECGAGEVVVARAIHARSVGAQGPFVVASAAVFADAVADPSALRFAAPLVDAAEGGTLYLKRVGDLSAVQQEALAQFFRDRWERRSSSSVNGSRKFDRRHAYSPNARGYGMRILAASDRDLRTLAAVGQFRQDLYAHLSSVEIVVPPLRERLDDIPVLATWLLRWLAEQTGQSSKHFSQAALAHLQERMWRRNLRELEEVVAQAAALADGCMIEPYHLAAFGEAATIAPVPAASPRIERLSEVVQRHVLDVLTRCGGNKLRTAELLGISRSTLYRMLDSNADAMSVLQD